MSYSLVKQIVEDIYLTGKEENPLKVEENRKVLQWTIPTNPHSYTNILERVKQLKALQILAQITELFKPKCDE